MKFRSKVAGYVLGVRFYKGSTNTGTHSGHLWTKNGTILASVKFTGESSSGWQQANFSSPVAISANTTYIISYLAPKGGYPFDVNYFATNGVDNGPLHALSTTEEGGNDVYKYGGVAFPNSTWKAANYWVDVVFNTVPSTTATPVTVTGASKSTRLISSTATTSADTLSADPKTTETDQNSRLSCAPKSVQAGDFFTCHLKLGEPTNDVAENAIPVSTSSHDVRLPAALSVRSGKRSLSFRGFVDPASSETSVVISAGEGDSLVSDEISISPSSAPVISLPERQFVKLGAPIGFTVAAQDGSGLPVEVSAAELPEGATFDADSGRFLWTPSPNQAGDSKLTFAASNSAGVAAPGSVPVTIDSGLPLISKPELTACAPGAVASIQGRWLTSDDAADSDPSGASLQLAGSLVRINGSAVPVLSASSTRLTFLCPSADPGAQLDVTVETESGDSTSLHTTMLEANPVLLPAPDSNPSAEQPEGFISFSDSDRLAIVRDARQLGEPALPGDLVSIRATGLGLNADTPGAVSVTIGGIDAAIQSVTADPNAAGVYLVQVRVPEAAAAGLDIPVELNLRSQAGTKLTSAKVTLAIE
ncbi:MAG: DUF4082 domain-containing protein [Paludibaculum sp.]